MKPKAEWVWQDGEKSGSAHFQFILNAYQFRGYDRVSKASTYGCSMPEFG